ncbi:MAG: multicopper oxidase domain-containing protein [Flavobacteriales bacterium]|nr:multicopper oxidase domain-containing protein [Flavobacteriales bacterium]
MNNAGTFWYHPHGENKTDMQVSKGIAGMIIIRDEVEAALELPRTYGIDDFPIIVQTKSFDILYQIQIATHADTLLMVNGTVNAFLDAPAQVVRLRMLNGSSERTFLFGFSNDMNFSQIATDGGLKETPYQTNRLMLAPGERNEWLVDLSSFQDQTIYLMNYDSDLPNGTMRAENVGTMATLEGYDDNPLNGADFQVLQINVVAPTANAITTIPSVLTTITPINISEVDQSRTMTMSAMEMGPMNMVEGPFGINNVQFDMDVINEIVQLGDVEAWTITNQTQVAHPFHIHDVEFQILDVNGSSPAAYQQGWKDVVLVMPQQSVTFITRFEDFADPVTPYMYHCHLLHHEDEGMMGSFLVVDPNSVDDSNMLTGIAYPNPARSKVSLSLSKRFDKSTQTVRVFDMMGNLIPLQMDVADNRLSIDVASLSSGMYTISIDGLNAIHFIKE